MLYVREAQGTVRELVERLTDAATENHFGVLGIHDLRQKMNAKGVEFDSECQVMEVCNPQAAKQVLEANPAISTAMPCRISIYEQDGKVKVATILPTAMLAMFNSPELDSVAREVEEAMKRIIDTACAAPATSAS